jgi:hypothetical protein
VVSNSLIQKLCKKIVQVGTGFAFCWYEASQAALPGMPRHPPGSPVSGTGGIAPGESVGMPGCLMMTWTLGHSADGLRRVPVAGHGNVSRLT